MQQQQQQQHLLGPPRMGSTEGCNSLFAAMKLPDFPTLQGIPLSMTFPPEAYPDSVSPPDNPFSIDTWGAPSRLNLYLLA